MGRTVKFDVSLPARIGYLVFFARLVLATSVKDLEMRVNVHAS
jgi:hypothetical protein